MNVDKIRIDFPVLANSFHYLDSACMSLKPVQVVDAMNRYYLEFPSCGERSSHRLGKMVTEEVHEARKRISAFIGSKEDELIFTKNTTEGLNLAASSLNLEKNDIVLTSDKEHNSNFLPWGRFERKILATVDGRFDLDSFEKSMGKNVRVVAVQQTSNIDGMTFPIKEIAKICHDFGSVLVVDGAQGIPHKEIDVKKLGCGIYAFSGHKMLGPSIGCVYINKELMSSMNTFMIGGGTVLDVRDGNPLFLKGPERFEAGLQNYAGAIGLSSAVEYLKKVGMQNISKHEFELNKLITSQLDDKRISILGGTPEERGGIVSINIKGIDSREAAIMFDSFGVLVRGGFHCCHNWFNARNIAGSIRASLYLYNNEDDASAFAEAAKKVADMA